LTFDNHTIRLLEITDLENFFSLISDNRQRLEAFFAGTVAKTRTLSDTETYLIDISKKIAEKSYLPFVIENPEGKLVGFIDVKNIDWNIPKGELGCFIDASYAGKGFGKKAFSLFVAHLFKDFGFNKLFLRTHESNTAAKMLAQKCGFEVEGILRHDYKTTSGELVDLIYFGLVRQRDL
jgi:RimJ/RimL family protein N-acetyltransferase